MFGSFEKTVASAATAERLTSATKRVSWATVQAKSTNTGVVRVFGPNSDSTGGFTISASESFVIWSSERALAIDLNKMWADVAIDGEGVDVSYVE